MTSPTIGHTYTRITATGDRRIRIPEEIFTRFGVTWVRYTMKRGEVRCCTLDAWDLWMRRIA